MIVIERYSAKHLVVLKMLLTFAAKRKRRLLAATDNAEVPIGMYVGNKR